MASWDYVSKKPIEVRGAMPEEERLVLVQGNRIYTVSVSRPRRALHTTGDLVESDAFVRAGLDGSSWASPPGVPPYTIEVLQPQSSVEIVPPDETPPAESPPAKSPPPPTDQGWGDEFDDYVEEHPRGATGAAVAIGVVLGIGAAKALKI